MTKSKRQERQVSFLRELQLLRAFDDEEIGALADALVERRLKAGERLYEIGSPGRSCYIIEQGRVRLTIPREQGDDIELSQLGAGDILGQAALIDGKKRPASCWAVDRLTVHELDREVFEARFADGLHFAYKLLDVLSLALVRQLRTANESLIELAGAEEAATIPRPPEHPDVQSVFQQISGEIDSVHADEIEPGPG